LFKLEGTDWIALTHFLISFWRKLATIHLQTRNKVIRRQVPTRWWLQILSFYPYKTRARFLKEFQFSH
jgi:hypothetical protein